MTAMHENELGRPPGRQHGFTLVELMVSLLIGLLIILGATQLFIVSRQSFERVEDLGLRQGALNFSVDVLSRDIRRANRIIDDGKFIIGNDKDSELILGFSGLVEPGFCDGGEIKKKAYSLKKTDEVGDDWSLRVAVTCAGETSSRPIVPLVSGFAKYGLEAKADGVSGLWELTLRLAPIGDDGDPEEIVFRVMNRMRALKAGSGEGEAKLGYDSEGSKPHPIPAITAVNMVSRGASDG